MVLEPAFHHVDQPVIAIWICRHQEEAGVDEEPKRVVHDPFHHLAVQKLDPHPDSMNNRRGCMELQRVVFAVSLEIVDVKDRLGVGRSDLLNCV